MSKRKQSENPPALRLEWRDAADLADNPKNWRRHPESQLAALEGALAEVGWAGACLYNERTGRLIDGHARRKIAQKQGGKVPVLVGSWDEATEAKILATLDPLSVMAEADPAMLDQLLREVNTGCAELQQMLDDLQAEAQPESAGGAAPAGDDSSDETIDPSEDSPKLKAFIERREKSRQRANDAHEVNFWVCLVFQSWEQKQEFLGKLTCPTLYGMYADGERFAADVGLPVTPNTQAVIRNALDAKLSALVLTEQPGESP